MAGDINSIHSRDHFIPDKNVRRSQINIKVTGTFENKQTCRYVKDGTLKFIFQYKTVLGNAS